MTDYIIPEISEEDVTGTLLRGLCEACCDAVEDCKDMDCDTCLFNYSSEENLKDRKDKLLDYLLDKNIIDKAMAMRLTLEHQNE